MVGMELRQQLKLAQQLVMTPQLQQAIKLLQLSRTELVDMVQQELEENPVLEELAEVPDRSQADRDNTERVEVTSKPTEQEAMTGANEIDWEKYLENYANQAPTPTSYQAPADGLPTLEATLGSKESLADHLRWQLRMTTVSDEEEHFINLVIGNLDADGYLKDATIEDLAVESNLELEDAEEVLKMVQMFDPVGVAARDLRECLLVQAEALELDADVFDIIGICPISKNATTKRSPATWICPCPMFSKPSKSSPRSNRVRREIS